MWGYITAALFAFWSVYLSVKYGLKPYLRMLNYSHYKGAIWVPFYPVLGPFKQEEETFELTSDDTYFSKTAFQAQPEARLYVFNAFENCFLMLVDPALLTEFFQCQQHYQREDSFI